MSEPSEKPVVGGKIVIEVTDNDVRYDSEMSVPEIVFWMRAIETMIMKNIMGES